MYWLLKSEPTSFSIDDLVNSVNQTTSWEGVRNYQARNMIRDQMQAGQQAFFYHSSCQQPGIVAIVTIITAGYPDDTALNCHSPYYDAKSTLEHPRWFRVDVQLLRKFTGLIPLAQLRNHPLLQDLLLLQKGSRLSVLPITQPQWHAICQLEPHSL